MPTQPTLVAVKAGLVTQMTAKLATAAQDGGQVQVSYAWPGPDTKPESVFFGRHPASAVSSDTTVDLRIPNAKAGRAQRDEDYDLPLTVWVFRPDLTAAAAQTAEQQALTLVGLIGDIWADDVEAGQAIQWGQITSITSLLVPHDAGWACDCVFTIHVKTRLT